MASGNALNTGSNGFGQDGALTQTDMSQIRDAFEVVGKRVDSANILFPAVVDSLPLQMYFRALVVKTIMSGASINLLEIARLIDDAVRGVSLKVESEGVQWLSSQASIILREDDE